MKRKPPYLYRQLELLALHDLGVVDPEEVRVQNRLDDASDDGDPVGLVLRLGQVAVDPIGDVEPAVDAQGEQVVRGDGLGLACALQHKQLRQDGHRLQPDRERPQDLGQCVAVGDDESQHRGAA